MCEAVCGSAAMISVFLMPSPIKILTHRKDERRKTKDQRPVQHPAVYLTAFYLSARTSSRRTSQRALQKPPPAPAARARHVASIPARKPARPAQLTPRKQILSPQAITALTPAPSVLPSPGLHSPPRQMSVYGALAGRQPGRRSPISGL